jgi:putative ABC transport system permease protein
MLFVSIRDLQWRLRRFMIGVLATGLVFALALLISGISASFHNEVNRTVDAFKADSWVVSEKATGPFTTPVLFPQAAAAQIVQSNPGAQAAPIVVLRSTVHTSRLRDVNVIGAVPGSIGWLKLHDGRLPSAPGEMLADHSLGVGLGSKLSVGGQTFTVVGRTSGASYLGGTPVAMISINDAQKLSLGGQPLASAIIVRGTVHTLPSGLHVVTNAQAIADLRRPLKSATGTIDILRILLWLVAGGIIGSVLYLQAIERTRDFAVFKATGVASRSVVLGLALQAIFLALVSAAVAVLLTIVLKPTMPMQVDLAGSTYIVLVVVAIAVGLLASISGLRRALSVDPALAFGGA